MAYSGEVRLNTKLNLEQIDKDIIELQKKLNILAGDYKITPIIDSSSIDKINTKLESMSAVKIPVDIDDSISGMKDIIAETANEFGNLESSISNINTTLENTSSIVANIPEPVESINFEKSQIQLDILNAEVKKFETLYKKALSAEDVNVDNLVELKNRMNEAKQVAETYSVKLDDIKLKLSDIQQVEKIGISSNVTNEIDNLNNELQQATINVRESSIELQQMGSSANTVTPSIKGVGDGVNILNNNMQGANLSAREIGTQMGFVVGNLRSFESAANSATGIIFMFSSSLSISEKAAKELGMRTKEVKNLINKLALDSPEVQEAVLKYGLNSIEASEALDLFAKNNKEAGAAALQAGRKIQKAQLLSMGKWALIAAAVALVIKAVTDFNKKAKEITETFVNVGKTVVKSFENIAKSVSAKIFIGITYGIKQLGKAIDILAKKIIDIGKSTVVFESLKNAVGDVMEIVNNFISVNTNFVTSLNQIRANILTGLAPAIYALIPIINAFAQAISYITALFAKFMAIVFGKTIAETIAMAKAMLGASKSMDKASKSAKKLAALLPIDEMNKLGEASSGAGSGIDDIGFDFTVPDLTKFDEFFKKLKGFFTDLDFDYFKNLGIKIGKNISKALYNIPWGEIKKAAKIAGGKIGSTISGIFGTEAGTVTAAFYTIAETLNTGVGFLLEWAKKTDFKDLGKELSNGIYMLFETFDFIQFANAINEWTNGILDLMITAITDIEWQKNAEKIVELLNRINWIEHLTKVGTVIKEALKGILTTLSVIFTDNQWALDIASGIANGLNEVLADPILMSKAGTTLGKLVKTLLRSINTFVTEFKWTEVGTALTEAIKKFIAEVKPEDVADTINSLVNGILNFFNTADFSLIVDFAKKIIENIEWDKALELIKKVEEIKKIPETIFKMIKNNITPALAKDFADKFIKFITIPFDDFNGDGIASKIVLEILRAWSAFILTGGVMGLIARIGFNLVAGIFEGIPVIGDIITWIKEKIFDPFMNAIKWLFGIHSPSTVMEEIGEFLIEGLFGGILNVFGSVAEFFGNIFSGLAEFFDGIFGTAWNVVKEIWSGVKGFFSNRWEDIKGAFGTVGNWFEEKFTNARELAQRAWSGVKGFFSNRWEDIKGAFVDPIGTFKKIGENVKSGFEKGLEGLKEGAKTVFDGAVNGIKSLLGIHSPSKVFAGMGENSSDGFIIGMKELISNVADIFDSMLDDTDIQPFITIGELIGNLILQGLQNMTDPIMVFFENLYTRISQLELTPNIQIPQIPEITSRGIIGSATISAMAERNGGYTKYETNDLSELVAKQQETIEEIQINNQYQRTINETLLQILAKTGIIDGRMITNLVSGEFGVRSSMTL